MKPRGWILPAVLSLVVVSLATGPAMAGKGLANGKVGLIDTPVKAYGFSSYSGLWTSTSLASPAITKAAGQFLGYVRTSDKLCSYNSANDHWFKISYTGQVLGEDVKGATSCVWTNMNMYAIASLWAIWRAQPYQIDEAPRGGGSAGSFGLFWTNRRGYAFHSASGTWMPQDLTGSVIGGITLDGFGLIYTSTGAFTFDPTPGGWSALDLGEPRGVSAAGGGSVGLVWSQNSGQAYSAVLDMWVPFNDTERILGGSAGGEVAILWDSAQAYCFNANTGAWSPVALQSQAMTSSADDLASAGSFSFGPNPSFDQVNFRLPNTGAWTLQVFDVRGALIRGYETDTHDKGESLSWDGLDTAGQRVAAGTYWVRAESAEGQVEARRIVMLH